MGVFALAQEVSVGDAVTLTTLAEHTTHRTYNSDHHGHHNSLSSTTQAASQSPLNVQQQKVKFPGAARESSISFARLRETPGRDLSGFRLMAKQRGILWESSGLAVRGGAMGGTGRIRNECRDEE
ncbi:hypothetical protein E2C01_077138 [Portunus trituberculatus]|uniref:Uncharacterized protein n=1 Tax=Portunus trituberculatus TaxID=210409 RepID=A0A5B7IKL5_PORTR|nr:hypothetical protein [Portunus trituberculatus]